MKPGPDPRELIDAFASMAQTLQALNPTREERRRNRNARYYERNRERWSAYRRLMYRLRALDAIGALFGDTYANR